MTVATSLNRRQHTGDGVQDTFQGPYILKASQLVVEIRYAGETAATQRTRGTHYTLSGERDPDGAVVTFIHTGDIDYRPPAGSLLILRRVFDMVQATDFIASGLVRADVLEASLDLLTLFSQELRDTMLTRGYAVPAHDRVGGQALPVEADRANRLMGWGADGRLQLYLPPELVGVPVTTPARPLVPADLGLDGTGAGDDAPRLAQLDNGQGIRLPAGTYRIGSDLTLFARLDLDAGAVFKIPEGVTLRLVGPFRAHRRRIIDGEGAFLCREQNVIFPEWWGAFMDGVTDDGEALQAALDFGNQDGHRQAVVDLGGRVCRCDRPIRHNKDVQLRHGTVALENIPAPGPAQVVAWEIFGTDQAGVTHPVEIPRQHDTIFDDVILRGHAAPAGNAGPSPPRGPTYTPNLWGVRANTSNFAFGNVEIIGFEVGLTNGPNSYIIDLITFKILWCNYGCLFTAQTNSGEKWSWLGGSIAGCNYGFDMAGGGVNLHLNNVSIDYMYKRVISRLGKVMIWTDCHIEHLNYPPEGDRRFVVSTDGTLMIRGGDLFDDASNEGPLFLVDGLLVLDGVLWRVQERAMAVELLSNGRVEAVNLHKLPGAAADEIARVHGRLSGLRNSGFALPITGGVLPGWTFTHGSATGMATLASTYDGPSMLEMVPTTGSFRGILSARGMIPPGKSRIKASVNLRGGGTGGTTRLRLRQFDPDAPFLEPVTPPATPPAAASVTDANRNGAVAEWERLRIGANCLATGGFYTLEIAVITTSSTTPYYIDNPYIEFS